MRKTGRRKEKKANKKNKANPRDYCQRLLFPKNIQGKEDNVKKRKF